MSRTIRLNPCDYLFWGQHRMNARKGEGGNVAFMLLDVEGDLEASWLRHALAATFRSHPVTMSRFGNTLVTGRPHWIVPHDAGSAASDMADRAFVHRDWRCDSDWKSKLDEVSAIGNVVGFDTRRGPLVRLEHYGLPNHRHRLIIRWPHMLMDAEGAQWFLSELTRCGEGATPPPSSLTDDGPPIDPLQDYSFLARWKLFAKGAAYQRSNNAARVNLMPPDSKTGAIDHRVIHRNWSAGETQSFQSNAKTLSPHGPLLYARHLASCVLLATHKLFLARSVSTDHYLITLPMRVGASDPATRLFDRRPMNGNYLVSPMLCIPRDQIEDPQAVGRLILEQLNAYHTRRGDLLQWTMMWAASLIHAWAYELIFALPFGGGRFVTGNSFYGEINPPVRLIGRATVINLWGGGPNTNPPALNPVFSRFGDRLNFTLTYTRPTISDATADEYVRLIEAEMFGAQ